MKFVAILSLVLGLSVADVVTTCMSYVCDPKGVDWPSKACGMIDKTNSTQYDIRSDYCSSDEACDYNSNPSTCVKKTNPAIAYPGEPCDDTNTCIGSNCTKGVCSSLTEGAGCTNIYDCGGSLTCQKYGKAVNTCIKVIAAGATGCYEDSDCVQNAGCVGGVTGAAPVQGTCYTYMSIQSQSAAQGCTATGIDLVANVYCQSGYCYLPTGGQPLCAGNVQSSGTVPVKCTNTEQCTSTNDPKAEAGATVSCTCSTDGNYYCPLFPGDSMMSDYLSLQQTYLNSTSLAACNSYRNNAVNPPYPGRDYCTMAGSTKSDIYTSFKALNYARFVMADKCVLKFLAHDYYEYEDAASWTVLSVLGFALIY